MEYSQVIIILTSLFFSALFSGIEIAFVASNKLQIELQNKQGFLSGKILSKFLNEPSKFIGTTLIGNTLALVIYGIFMANFLEPFFIRMLPDEIGSELTVILLQTIVSTLLVLAVAEFTPKSLFLLNPNGLLAVFAVPMLVIYYIFFPVVWVVVNLSRFLIVKIFGLAYSEDKPVFRLTDLNNYIKNTALGNKAKEDTEKHIEVNTKIFNNALEFKTVKVRECMKPRTEIVAVDIEDDVQTLRQAFIESGHSKILVYRDNIDNVIGYCHSLELFKKPKKIDSMLTSSIIFVPETMLVNELMIQFITERKTLALVVDEFGGTSGIISMEDIIEEIFGEIRDEHDADLWLEERIDNFNYLLSGRHEIDYLNEKYNWKIPVGDYETLGGFILSVTEEIPKENEIINTPFFIFTIISMQDARIDKIKMTIKPFASEAQ
jgi:putative hemolysin